MTEHYAIVPVPEPGTARDAVLRDAIAIGGSDELLRKFFACDATERDLANQQRQTAEVASRVADVGAHLMDQVEALAEQKQEQVRADAKRKADKARRDAEAEAEAEAEAREREAQAYLDDQEKPDPDHPDAPTPFDGDLSELGPVEHEKYAPDDQGDLPRQLTAEVPVEPGNYFEPEPDPEELGGPPDLHQVPQPVSISLNSNEVRP
jgi:hypothetical protein